MIQPERPSREQHQSAVHVGCEGGPKSVTFRKGAKKSLTDGQRAEIAARLRAGKGTTSETSHSLGEKEAK